MRWWQCRAGRRPCIPDCRRGGSCGRWSWQGQVAGPAVTVSHQCRLKAGMPLEYHGRDRLTGLLVHRLVGPHAAVAGDQAGHGRLTVVPKLPFDAPYAEARSQRPSAWLNCLPGITWMGGSRCTVRRLIVPCSLPGRVPSPKPRGACRIAPRQPGGFGLPAW